MWNSRDSTSHYIQADWYARNFNSSGKIGVAKALVDPKDVLLPYLYIKLGSMKNFFKGMDR